MKKCALSRTSSSESLRHFYRSYKTEFLRPSTLNANCARAETAAALITAFSRLTLL